MMCLGIPGEVLEIRDEQGLKVGKVQFGGITRDVCLACIPDIALGEFVLVHVGFAISKVDKEEAARAYAEAGREDLAGAERTEAELISTYLPEQLSEAELQTIVEQAIRDSGAESMQDMGKVMKQAMAIVDGRADGATVSELVRASLQG